MMSSKRMSNFVSKRLPRIKAKMSNSRVVTKRVAIEPAHCSDISEANHSRATNKAIIEHMPRSRGWGIMFHPRPKLIELLVNVLTYAMLVPNYRVANRLDVNNNVKRHETRQYFL